MGRLGGRVVRQFHIVRGIQRLGHSAHYREDARAAAVDHSRFLEGGEEVRRVLERDFHFRDEGREIVFERVGRLFGGFLHSLAENGEDGALHGHGDCFVGFFHARGHGGFEGAQVRRLGTFEPLADSGEDARKDHAAVAAGAQKHA